MSACYQCDAELETTLPGATKFALCEACRKNLQAKVDRAVQAIEADMLERSIRKSPRRSAARTVMIAAICTAALAALLAALLASIVGFGR